MQNKLTFLKPRHKTRKSNKETFLFVLREKIHVLQKYFDPINCGCETFKLIRRSVVSTYLIAIPRVGREFEQDHIIYIT